MFQWKPPTLSLPQLQPSPPSLILPLSRPIPCIFPLLLGKDCCQVMRCWIQHVQIENPKGSETQKGTSFTLMLQNDAWVFEKEGPGLLGCLAEFLHTKPEQKHQKARPLPPGPLPGDHPFQKLQYDSTSHWEMNKWKAAHPAGDKELQQWAIWQK